MTTPTAPAVIFNPVAHGEKSSDHQTNIRRAFERRGHDVMLFETTEEDFGEGVTAAAIEAEADLICVSGGDGTLMACITTLAETNIPLAILPAGTGNLLAINFDVPLELEEAVDVALHGERRRIDVGAIDHHRFAIMCGLGFDAAMLRDTNEKLKARLGPVAYVMGGLRNLHRPATRFSIVLDGKQSFNSAGHAILIANVGRVQGGLAVHPDADPCDGLLDVAIVDAKGVLQWARVAYRVMFGRHKDDGRLRFFQVRQIDVRAESPLPFELDGDVLADRDCLSAKVLEGALVLCVPAADVSASATEER